MRFRRGVSGIAVVIISVIVLMMVVWAAALVGGVFASSVKGVFSELNVSPNWTNVFGIAESYSITFQFYLVDSVFCFSLFYLRFFFIFIFVWLYLSFSVL